MSSDMEEESNDITEVYIATHSHNLLSPEFMRHFEEEAPHYTTTTKKLIEDFMNVSYMFILKLG